MKRMLSAFFVVALASAAGAQPKADAKALLEDGFQIVGVVESGRGVAVVLQKDEEAYFCQMAVATGAARSTACVPFVAGSAR